MDAEYHLPDINADDNMDTGDGIVYKCGSDDSIYSRKQCLFIVCKSCCNDYVYSDGNDSSRL